MTEPTEPYIGTATFTWEHYKQAKADIEAAGILADLGTYVLRGMVTILGAPPGERRGRPRKRDPGWPPPGAALMARELAKACAVAGYGVLLAKAVGARKDEE